MSHKKSDIWCPRPEDLDSSNIAIFMRKLGFTDYDKFYRFSIENPESYWRAVNKFCKVVWSTDYDKYMDDTRGPEFPRWFPGGELNWVDTILQWAYEPGTKDQPAIIAEREAGVVESVTYRELAIRIRRFAAGLRTRGVKKGDRVGILMENGVEANISLLALAYIGAIAVPLFSGFGVDAILARLESCDARVLIVSTGFNRRGKFISTREVVRKVCELLPSIEMVIWKRSPEGPELEADDIDWCSVAKDADPGGAAERMQPSSPFMVIYTSGTTGKPKGPVHTHGNFPIKIVHDAAFHFEINAGDVFCWPADIGWIAGTLVSGCVLMRGATLVTYDGAPDFPTWSRMGSIIEKYKVTHYGASPTLIRGAAANESVALSHNLSSIRYLITAGEVIDPQHFIWYQKNFGAGTCPVINYTGGTEVSGALLSSVVVKPISPGYFNTSCPGLEADVVNDAGESIVGEVGELAIRQPFVGMADSFWKDDERYVETYWSTIPGTWIHGDLAVRMSDGSFQLRGRSDDTLKIAGKRLGPSEVEEILLELDGISEAAAIGVDDDMKGQKLLVFVVSTEDWKGNVGALESRVAARVADRLGRPFKPSKVYVVNQLPKTRSSKVMRRVIRNIYSGIPLGDMSSLNNPSAVEDLKTMFPAQNESDG